MPLPDLFIQKILDHIDKTNVIGIAIAGSFARGDQSRFSDVDLDIFVSKLPDSQYDRYTLRYWEDCLVSLKYVLLDDERTALTDPERAIWAVPGLRQMKILLDKDGELNKLQQAALAFDWSPLQPSADEFAVENLMGCAEEAHKILNGLMRGDESMTLYAVWGLVSGLLRAVAVQRGLMIASENHYFDLIQDSVGRDAQWTRSFRTAWGLDVTPNIPQYESRGRAALALYRHTATMFESLIPEKHREVVNRTLYLIAEAGY